MRNKFRVLVAVLASFYSTSTVVAEHLSPVDINLVTDSADKICKIVADHGRVEGAEVEAGVKLEANGLLKKLTDAGGKLGGKFNEEQYENMRREDLPAALSRNLDCRERVFNRFMNIIERPTANSPRNSDAKKRPEHSSYPFTRPDVERTFAAKLVSRVNLNEAAQLANSGRWKSYASGRLSDLLCFSVSQSLERTPSDSGSRKSLLYWSFGRESNHVFTTIKTNIKIDQTKPARAVFEGVAYELGVSDNLLFINSMADSRSIHREYPADRQMIVTYNAGGDSIMEVFTLDGFPSAERAAFGKCFPEGSQTQQMNNLLHLKWLEN